MRNEGDRFHIVCRDLPTDIFRYFGLICIKDFLPMRRSFGLIKHMTIRRNIVRPRNNILAEIIECIYIPRMSKAVVSADRAVAKGGFTPLIWFI